MFDVRMQYKLKHYRYENDLRLRHFSCSVVLFLR